MSTAPAAGAKKGGSKKKLMIIVVALASIGGGATVPMVMGGSKEKDPKAEAKKKKSDHPPVNVDFGDVTVNLAEERMTRYLKIKITLKVEGFSDDKVAGEHLAHFKPGMKSWLIGHLAGKSLKEVSGTVGVKRLQREILEKFEEMIAHEENSHGTPPKHPMILRDVLFTEYVVQ